MNTFYLNCTLEKQHKNVLVVQFGRASPEALAPGEVRAEREKLAEQIQSHDVIVFDGGDAEKLIDAIQPLDDWIMHLNKKTIYAWGAGIMALSYLSYDKKTWVEVRGTGILPIKTSIHHKGAHFWCVQRMSTTKPLNMPVVPIYDDQALIMCLPDMEDILK